MFAVPGSTVPLSCTMLGRSHRAQRFLRARAAWDKPAQEGWTLNTAAKIPIPGLSRVIGQLLFKSSLRLLDLSHLHGPAVDNIGRARLIDGHGQWQVEVRAKRRQAIAVETCHARAGDSPDMTCGADNFAQTEVARIREVDVPASINRQAIGAAHLG